MENLVGYAKSDLVVPQGLAQADMAGATEHARAWCTEVNARRHSETCAVPSERLEAERPLLRPLPSLRPSFGRAVARKVDRLSCVRFGSARYSVPTKFIGRVVEVQVGGDEVESDSDEAGECNPRPPCDPARTCSGDRSRSCQ